MTFHTLKRRDIAEINRVFEGFVCFMAGFAFAICQAAKINWMLEGNRLWVCGRLC